MPLTERWKHLKTCKVEEKTPVQVLATGEQTTGTPSPSRKQLDVDKVVRFVTMFLRGAKESSDRRAYLAAAVQAAHRDQGFEISDAESLEVLAALVSREPAIERALEPPEILGPPSRSTTSPTRKGGARGRV